MILNKYEDVTLNTQTSMSRSDDVKCQVLRSRRFHNAPSFKPRHSAIERRVSKPLEPEDVQ